MVVLGLWLGVIGYAVLYSGVQKLGGKSCSLAQAFRGTCTQAAPSTTATAGAPPGMTLLAGRQAASAQQQQAVPSAPVMVA